MSYFGYTIKDIEKQIHKKEMSVSDVVDLSYKRIAEVDGQVKAFLTLDEENARAHAKKLDEAAGDQHKLFGIPNAIKDNIMTKGLRTTRDSQFLKNFNNQLYNATAVEKLKLEKTNTKR